MRLIALAAVAVGVLAAGLLWWKQRSESAEWRRTAVTQLSRLSIAEPPVSNEWSALRVSITDTNGRAWTSDHVLLMANGEFILYKYRHGANGYFPPHLFVGRGSDGRWLWSDYHFCNSMAMVRFTA